MANVMTPKFRVSYPNVFKARLNDMSGKQEYSVVAIFPKNADLSKLKAAVEACVAEKLGTDKSKWPKNMKTPFRKNEEREKEGVLPPEYEAGGFFINLKSAQKPGVVDANVQPIIDENEFYAGCFAHATVRPYYYDQKGNKGVAFGLQNIQKLGDGEPLSGRVAATSEFAAVEGAASSSSDDMWS